MEPIIAENRIHQLLARFEPWQDGFVYHHDASTGGLPCTREELESLVVDFATIHRRAQRGMTAWVVVAAIAMASLSVTGTLELARWQQVVVFLVPFPFAIQQFWRAHRLPWHRFGRRTPVTSPRSGIAGVWSRTAALPMSLVVAMIAVSSLLAWRVLKDGWQPKDAEYLPGMLLPLACVAFIVYAKSRRKP